MYSQLKMKSIIRASGLISDIRYMKHSRATARDIPSLNVGCMDMNAKLGIPPMLIEPKRSEAMLNKLSIAAE
jgi:hypothetical protein